VKRNQRKVEGQCCAFWGRSVGQCHRFGVRAADNSSHGGGLVDLQLGKGPLEEVRLDEGLSLEEGVELKRDSMWWWW